MSVAVAHVVVWLSSSLRDGLYMLLFPHPNLIAKTKLDYQMTLNDLLVVVGTGAIGVVYFEAFHVVGVLDVAETTFTTVSNWAFIWFEFISLLLFFEASMRLLHPWMHHNASVFQKVHARHHGHKKNLQACHAFVFTLSDLIIEFALAPLLLLLVKTYVLGLMPSLNLASLMLMVTSEIRGHSVNPHSPYYFNPILDAISKNNIRHTLHHAAENEYMCAVSFDLSMQQRRHDVLRYQKVFGVDLGYGYKI